MNIVLYTIGCPNCNTLHKKLDSKNIQYSIVTDTDEMRRKGYEHLPVLEVDGKPYNFFEAIQWIKENVQ